eukprot:357033-Chlamydomonas_euryale.AAC.3
MIAENRCRVHSAAQQRINWEALCAQRQPRQRCDRNMLGRAAVKARYRFRCRMHSHRRAVGCRCTCACACSLALVRPHGRAHLPRSTPNNKGMPKLRIRIGVACVILGAVLLP